MKNTQKERKRGRVERIERKMKRNAEIARKTHGEEVEGRDNRRMWKKE